METRLFRPYINIIILMLLTSLALAFTVDVKLTDQPGVRTQLPERVLDWQGYDVRFCQNRECRGEFLAAHLDNPDMCPNCGGTLDSMSPEERSLLPKDTVVEKKRYIHPDGASIFVTIVLSGQERSSIHRPEACVLGQGRTIVESSIIAVPLEHSSDVDIKVLDLVRSYTSARSGQVEVPQYYAYWFVGRDRETAENWARMFWMAYDRIVRNVSHRWAYVSLAGTREPGKETHKKQIKQFVKAFYPEIRRMPEN